MHTRDITFYHIMIVTNHQTMRYKKPSSVCRDYPELNHIRNVIDRSLQLISNPRSYSRTPERLLQLTLHQLFKLYLSVLIELLTEHQ